MQTPIHAKKTEIFADISNTWDESILPELIDYIKIPNKSPMFDADWEQNGYMARAMQLITAWCERQVIAGLKLELIEEAGRTPLLFIEIPGQIDDTIVMYGHMDKQPEMRGWDDDLGPWLPVLRDDKLYGRGGADDGYAVFASLTAIATLQKYNIPHARCVVIIEACEESGSYDLPHYLKQLKSRIGTPNLVICLDSGCANYEQLWTTTSLRGMTGGELNIKVLSQGIHSGIGSGVVPSCADIFRQLIDRVVDAKTGEVILPEFSAEVPKERVMQAKATAEMLGKTFYTEYPFYANTQPVNKDVSELLLNRSWRAQLSVTGIDGFPKTANAGNVTLPKMSARLSLRLPPTLDAHMATALLKKTLEDNPPFNAEVQFTPEPCANGWNAPAFSDWLISAGNEASQLFYAKDMAYLGEGGSIPFMGMLGDMFPEAQFLITGVLGPKSNAHGPNEFLHIPMAKKLTGCVCAVIAAHYQAFA